MTSADWNEIKRLAADFQRAQLTSSLQRLSERNCIEVINKLIEFKLLDVFYTTDGKEYITPSQLIKEIKEELFIHQGRINLTELCTLLNIDLTLLEKKANDVANSDPSIQLVLGQLISEDYLDILAEEVNERLQQKGSITIADIAKSYDLPGDFLLKCITRRLGKIIKGHQDEGDQQTFFTEAFISRHKAQIQGVLAAITRPTSVSSIVLNYQFQEKLFFNIAEKLIAKGSIAGVISGGRVLTQAIYIPKIYSKAQYDWVDSFLKQNGYLEFDALQRLGISDPAGYIKKNFSNINLTFVDGACVGQVLIDQIDANLEDALINGQYVDVAPFLPSGFSNEVCTSLINLALDARKVNAKLAGCTNINCQIFCDTVVVSENLLTKISLKLEEIMPEKAKEVIAQGAFKHQLSGSKSKVDEESSKNKKDDRRKKAVGGKSGGGTQGRETKTKSSKSKNKGRKGITHDSDDEEEDYESHRNQKGSSDVEFLSHEELQTEISKFPEFEDSYEELLEAISGHLHEPLSKKFNEVAKTAFLATMASGGGTRKKTHQQLQDKVLLLITTVRLAEKGLKEFGDDIQNQLCKYLLRTHCAEIVNELVLYLADDSHIDLKDSKEISPELRLKIIIQLDDDMKQPLLAVNKCLTASTIEQFLLKVDDSIAAADILMKKKDNKKDRQFLLSHRSSLVEQLNASLNPAISLHLSCLILFQAVTGNLLHASGKFVPQILAFLKLHLSQDFYDILYEYQGLVMKSLTSKGECAEQSTMNTRLEELSPKVKELTITFKKTKRENSNSISED